MFLGRTVLEKNVMLTSSYHGIFFKNCATKEYENFFLYKVSIWVNIQKNVMFLGGTVLEKNAMLTCKISKLFIRTIVKLRIFARYHRIFLENCATRKHDIFFV